MEHSIMSKKLFIPDPIKQKRQADLSADLREIVLSYPDQLQVILDELCYQLDSDQLYQIEDLVVNQYGLDDEGVELENVTDDWYDEEGNLIP
tara:strand:- start:4059 stop:4334 length:276 start_codon:yes stop_codon:yes gene_type:complete